MKLQLSIGMASNPRTWPVFDGRVSPDGIDLVPSKVFAPELFWRQLKFADFDVAEMSFSSLMIAVAGGDDRWVGLPVFTTRRFFHTEIMVRRDSGIERPEDLKGQAVAVPEFQQTANLWTRGILEHEFGVKTTDMEYWMERLPSHSHRGAVGYEPPPGVVIRQIPPEKSIASMMLSGEIKAALHLASSPKWVDPTSRTLVDRSFIDFARNPDIRPLFADPVAEGVRYYRKTGIFPINHGMVVKRSIVEKHPWVVLNLYKAFDQANRIANEERLEHCDYYLATGLLPREAADALRKPLVQHGIKANRKTLETAAQYSFEQKLTPRLMTLEEMFAPVLMQQ